MTQRGLQKDPSLQLLTVQLFQTPSLLCPHVQQSKLKSQHGTSPYNHLPRLVEHFSISSPALGTRNYPTASANPPSPGTREELQVSPVDALQFSSAF